MCVCICHAHEYVTDVLHMRTVECNRCANNMKSSSYKIAKTEKSIQLDCIKHVAADQGLQCLPLFLPHFTLNGVKPDQML